MGGEVVAFKVPGELRCTKCGAKAKASCDCGASYLPAGELAAKMVQANPEKSDRAIAAQIGVSHKTVERARKGSTVTNVTVEKRVGKDGKARKMPKPKKEAPEPRADTPEVIWRRGLLARAEEAMADAAYETSWRKYKIGGELVRAARKAARAWDKLADFLERSR